MTTIQLSGKRGAAHRPLQSVTVQIGEHQLTAEPTITPEATEILNALSRGN
jgi:hypothetical protein